jgi:hypothetical protein
MIITIRGSSIEWAKLGERASTMNKKKNFPVCTNTGNVLSEVPGYYEIVFNDFNPSIRKEIG